MPERQLTELEEKAAKVAGIDGWRAWKFRVIHDGILCTGAVCPSYKTGPRAGEPNVRLRDRSTELEVFLPAAYRTDAAIVSAYLNKMTSNIPGLKMTFLQRELVKAAMRTLIGITNI